MGVSSDGITSRAGRAASYKHFITAGVVKIKTKSYIRAPRFELGISCV